MCGLKPINKQYRTIIIIMIMNVFLKRLSMWNIPNCPEQVQIQKTQNTLHITHPKQHVSRQSCSNIHPSRKEWWKTNTTHKKNIHIWHPTQHVSRQSRRKACVDLSLQVDSIDRPAWGGEGGGTSCTRCHHETPQTGKKQTNKQKLQIWHPTRHLSRQPCSERHE